MLMTRAFFRWNTENTRYIICPLDRREINNRLLRCRLSEFAFCFKLG